MHKLKFVELREVHVYTRLRHVVDLTIDGLVSERSVQLAIVSAFAALASIACTSEQVLEAVDSFQDGLACATEHDLLLVVHFRQERVRE